MKSKIALFVVIILTVLLGGAGVYLSVILQKRQVSPEKGKAAEQPTSTINITGSTPSSPKTGEQVTITATVSLGGVSGTLTWSAPDGDPATSSQTITSSGHYTFTTTFATAGNYTVTANLVTATETLTDSSLISVKALGEDSVDLVINPAAPKLNDTVTLTATVSKYQSEEIILKFFVNEAQIGGDIEITGSCSETPCTYTYDSTYTFTSSGQYTLYAKLYNSSGQEITSDSVSVEIAEGGGGEQPPRPYCSNNNDYPTNMPSCSSLTVTKPVENYPDWYPGMELKLNVNGSEGSWCESKDYVPIKRFSYVDLGNLSNPTDDVWAVVPGSDLERGDFPHNLSEVAFTIPSGLNWQGTVANLGIMGGYGCVSAPADNPKNEANDDGRLCDGTASGWQVWKPCDSITNRGGACPHGWLPLSSFGNENCSCDYNASCAMVSTTTPIRVLKPPSCNSITVYKDKNSNGRYDDGEAVNSVQKGDTIRIHVDAIEGSKPITGYRYGYSKPSPGEVLTLTPENNDHEFIVDSTENGGNLTHFDNSTTEIIFGGGPATASPSGDGVSQNQFVECNGFGEIWDDEYKAIVGRCQSKCVKSVQVIRGAHVSVDEFVYKINNSDPSPEINCKLGLKHEDIMCKSGLLSPGYNVTYKVRITNDGLSDFTNVVLSNKALVNGAENESVWKVNIYDTGALLRECSDATCSSYIGDTLIIDSGNSTSTYVKWQPIPLLSIGSTWEATFTATASSVGSPSRVDMTAMVDANYCEEGDGCEDITWHDLQGSVLSMSVVKYSEPQLPLLITPGGNDITYYICFYDVSDEINTVEVTDHLDPKFLTYYEEPTSISHSGTFDGSNLQDPQIKWSFHPGSNGGANPLPADGCAFYTLSPLDSFEGTEKCVDILSNYVETDIINSGSVNPLNVYARSGVANDVCGATSSWTIDKTFTPSSIVRNGTSAVTLSITNSSGVTAYLEKVEDHLPSGFVTVGASTVVKPDGGSFTKNPTVSGNTVVWEFPTSGAEAIQMADGENTVITFTVKAGSVSGTYTNNACVVIPQGGCDTATISVGSLPGTGNSTIKIFVAGASIILLGVLLSYFRVPIVAYNYLLKLIGRGNKNSVEVVDRDRIRSKFEEEVEKIIEQDNA